MCNPVWSLCGTWHWGDGLGARSPRNRSVLLQVSQSCWLGCGRDMGGTPTLQGLCDSSCPSFVSSLEGWGH